MPGCLSARNKTEYIEKPKNSAVFTPPALANRIAEILKPVIKPDWVILDPSIGAGNLIEPYKNNCVIGVDSQYWNIKKSTGGTGRSYEGIPKVQIGEFQNIHPWPMETPDIIISNPPWNGGHSKGEPKVFLPFVFLMHITRLFGHEIPIVMIAPNGLLWNQRQNSKRIAWIKQNLRLVSIMPLPLYFFDKNNSGLPSSVFFFNIDGLKRIYWLDENTDGRQLEIFEQLKGNE